MAAGAHTFVAEDEDDDEELEDDFEPDDEVEERVFLLFSFAFPQ